MTPEFDQLFQPRQPWAVRVDDSRPKPPDLEGEQVVGSGPYKPYGYTPSDALDSCDISWWFANDVPQGQEIQYRFLIRVGYIGDTDLHLMMTDCIVAIQGRNLADLRKRITRGRVTFIQAFNPLIFQSPPATEPLITDISIMYPGNNSIIPPLL